MKIVDRYILRGFIFSFLVVFVAMVALTIMVDMVMNLDEFFKAGTEDKASVGTLGVIFHILSYYFYRTFEYFQLLCGAVMLVSAAFTIARLNKTNELVALKASGVSVYRVLWPIIVAGFVVCVLYVIDQEVIIPSCIDQLTQDRSMSSGEKEFPISYVTDRKNSLIYAPRFNPTTGQMLCGLAADRKTPNYTDPVRIVLRNSQTDENEFFIEADSARYDARRGGWVLTNGIEWQPPKIHQPIATEGNTATLPIDFYPSEIDPTAMARLKNANFYRYLSFNSMRQLLNESALANYRVVEIAMHKHFSKPLLNMVLLLLGLPFVVGREGKSYLVSVMICIGLFILVLGTEYVTAEFGQAGHLPPLLAVYLPVFIFTPVAIFSMEAVRT
jgi:lipopolysaccharide export system permease protein